MWTDTASLHGSAPGNAPVALLLADMTNDLSFKEGATLLRCALPKARRVAALVRRAREQRIPVIYANDNVGRWRSGFDDAVEYCGRYEAKGRALVELLAPQPDDYIVVKAKHSAFFATPLQTLLEHPGARRLIRAGVSGDVCILFTAHDADMLGEALPKSGGSRFMGLRGETKAGDRGVPGGTATTPNAGISLQPHEAPWVARPSALCSASLKEALHVPLAASPRCRLTRTGGRWPFSVV